jgi:hypothetical protein
VALDQGGEGSLIPLLDEAPKELSVRLLHVVAQEHLA